MYVTITGSEFAIEQLKNAIVAFNYHSSICLFLKILSGDNVKAILFEQFKLYSYVNNILN